MGSGPSAHGPGRRCPTSAVYAARFRLRGVQGRGPHPPRTRAAGRRQQATGPILIEAAGPAHRVLVWSHRQGYGRIAPKSSGKTGDLVTLYRLCDLNVPNSGSRRDGGTPVGRFVARYGAEIGSARSPCTPGRAGVSCCQMSSGRCWSAAPGRRRERRSRRAPSGGRKTAQIGCSGRLGASACVAVRVSRVTHRRGPEQMAAHSGPP